jgi:hypothetical protein
MSADMEAERCRALWCSVINQAINDATMRPKTIRPFTDKALTLAARSLILAKCLKKGEKPKNLADLANVFKRDFPNEVLAHARERALSDSIRIRDEARKWLTTDSVDLRKVCDMAGMEPDSVLERTRRMARQRWILDERTKKRISAWDEVVDRAE